MNRVGRFCIRRKESIPVYAHSIIGFEKNEPLLRTTRRTGACGKRRRGRARVVASRVGLKRRGEACSQSDVRREIERRPSETVISEVIQHRLLCLTVVFCEIFIDKK